MTPTTKRRPSRIAFGSCNDHRRVNPLWQVIESRAPAAFVWGGDAIYADIPSHWEWSSGDLFPTYHPEQCGTPDRVRQLYHEQLQSPEYQRLLKQNMTVFGTIDDHDFGCDNSDRTYAFKDETTKAFVDFVNEPQDSPIRKRASEGRGVYGVKLFDFQRPEGDELLPEIEACVDSDFVNQHASCQQQPKSTQFSDRSVAVFVLDVRTNKDPWNIPDGDFLGPDQWTWLETSLRNSRASVNVIVNGLQVNANLFPGSTIAEHWGAFSKSQSRLMNTILQSGVAAPLLVSGDVHMSQMLRVDCRDTVSSQTRPILEMTTSGMTHSWGGMPNEYLPQHFQKEDAFSWFERFAAFCAAWHMHILHHLLPWNSLLTSQASISHDGGMEGAETGFQYSLERNFGELEFNWEQRQVMIRSLGSDDKPLMSVQIDMDQLSGSKPMNSFHLKDQDFEHAATDSPRADGEPWVCLPYRGSVSTSAWIFGWIGVVMSSFPLGLAIPFTILWLWKRRRQYRRQALWQSMAEATSTSSESSISSIPSDISIQRSDGVPALVRTSMFSSQDSFLDKSASSSSTLLLSSMYSNSSGSSFPE